MARGPRTNIPRSTVSTLAKGTWKSESETDLVSRLGTCRGKLWSRKGESTFRVHFSSMDSVDKQNVMLQSPVCERVFCFPTTVGGDFSTSLVSSLV